MTDPDKLFNTYHRHYVAGSEGHFIDPALAQATHRDRVPRWMANLPRDIRILDAGCADGYLLSVLQHSGFEKLTGVDISPEMSALARERLKEHRIPIITSRIDTFLESTDDEFEVILFHHVIEHVPREETIGLLHHFYRRLSPGGWLSIRTPNANILATGYYCFGDFTHVVAFNEKSILQVLEGAGFSAENVAVVAQPPRLFWSLRHPLRMIFRVLNRIRWRMNHMLHQAVYILGDIRPLPKTFVAELEVIARK